MKCVNISAKGDATHPLSLFSKPTQHEIKSGVGQAGGERRRGRSSRERIRAPSVASSVIQEWLCRLLVGPPIYTHTVRKTVFALSLPSSIRPSFLVQ